MAAKGTIRWIHRLLLTTILFIPAFLLLNDHFYPHPTPSRTGWRTKRGSDLEQISRALSTYASDNNSWLPVRLDAISPHYINRYSQIVYAEFSPSKRPKESDAFFFSYRYIYEGGVDSRQLDPLAPIIYYPIRLQGTGDLGCNVLYADGHVGYKRGISLLGAAQPRPGTRTERGDGKQ